MRNPTKQSLGVVAIIAAATMATGCGSGASSAASSATSTASTSTPSTSSTLATSDWPTTAPGAPAPSLATSTTSSARATQPPPSVSASPVRARVKAFVVAIVTTKGVSRQAWTTKVSSFVDPELARRLALTDPVNIPAQKVTGQPQLLYTGTSEAVTGWFVPTSATGYTVTMSQGGGQLQIVAVTPGRTAPTTSVPTENE